MESSNAIYNPFQKIKTLHDLPAAASALADVVIPKENTERYFELQHEQALNTGLRKELGWIQLTGLGIGATIGAGIFVVTGEVARDKTGPALFLSYIVSGIACLLSAFSYAEFASMSPTAGSAYGFTRATLGEFAGWVIGWDLILEYAVSAAGVAQGWSKYFNSLMILLFGEGQGAVPLAIRQAPWAYNPDTGEITATGAIFDLPAILIVFLVTIILVVGIKESAHFNTAAVAFKLAVVLFVICAGIAYIKVENFDPFMPYGFFGVSFFGYTAVGKSDPAGNSVGVLAGAGVVFFAYIGFDAVTTNAEECRNPKRDLPIGIIASLTISTLLYVAVSLVLVGMIPYNQIDRGAPLSSAFGAVGLKWAQILIAFGALAGLTSVLLVNLMGQPRILMAMGRDGLLPKTFFTDIHPIYRTPYKCTISTSIFVAIVSSLIPLSILVELVSMGTLMAFAMINISVYWLRKTKPNIPRPFLCPGYPYVPITGALFCITLMLSLPSANWIRLIVWFLIGLGIYYFYGRHNKLRTNQSDHRFNEPEINKLVFSPLQISANALLDVNEINMCSQNSQKDESEEVMDVVSPLHTHICR